MGVSRLTDKQIVFVEAYLETFNATEAARRAKYKGSYGTLRSIGSENLTKPNIRARINERLEEMAMGANEVLARISRMADSPDITDFIAEKELYDRDDEGRIYLVGYTLTVDLDAIRKAGLGNQIKKITQTSSGIQIEWYDAHAALRDLGRYHKLFTDKVEIDGLDDAIERQLARLASAGES